MSIDPHHHCISTGFRRPTRISIGAAHEASQLPELPGAEPPAALNDLLVRVRLMKSNQSNAK